MNTKETPSKAKQKKESPRKDLNEIKNKAAYKMGNYSSSFQ
jgi:hypothetical protein